MTTPIDGTSAPPARLPGFDYQRIDVKDVTINCAVRGRARRCCYCTAIRKAT